MASSEFIDPAKLDLDDQVVAINRITKVVKGGRRMRFAALVIVGDHKGHVGFGTGKAQEVPEAIRKAQAAAEEELDYCTYRWNYYSTRSYWCIWRWKDHVKASC